MDLFFVFLVGLLFAVAAAAPAIWLKIVLARQQKAAKREYRQRVQRLEDESMDALFSIDELGVVRSFNTAAEKLFGYRADDILYRSVGLIIPHVGPAESGYGINALLSAPKTRNGNGIQVQGQRKDGKIVPLDLRLSEHVRRGRRLFNAVARDLSDKQTAERCAREVQFLEGCLHSAGAPVMVVSPEGVIVRHNRAFEEMTGFTMKRWRTGCIGNCCCPTPTGRAARLQLRTSLPATRRTVGNTSGRTGRARPSACWPP